MCTYLEIQITEVFIENNTSKYLLRKANMYSGVQSRSQIKGMNNAYNLLNFKRKRENKTGWIILRRFITAF